MKKIIQRIKKEATANLRSVHGTTHWEQVATHGRLIALHEDVDGWIRVGCSQIQQSELRRG